MSYDLRVWEQPADRAAPASIDDVGRAMLALEGKHVGVNAKFVALAQRMAERFPVAGRTGEVEDPVWLADPVVEAQSQESAVWVIEVPADHRVPVTFFVAETATSLGLTVLDEQLGMAFLPGGRVLPDSKSPIWEGLRREMNAPQSEPRITKADMRKVMATYLRECVQKHGFEHDQSNKRADVAFARSTAAGRQMITLTVEGAVPRLSCVMYCKHRNDRAQQIFAEVFGPEWLPTRNTFEFNVGIFIGTFNGGLPFASRQDIQGIFALLADKAIPVLDAARSLAGLNEVMNRGERFPLHFESRHPNTPKSLAHYFHTHRLEPLIVAWLVGDPDFEGLVEEYRQLAKNRVDEAAELDKLLAHLRTHVQPADKDPLRDE